MIRSDSEVADIRYQAQMAIFNAKAGSGFAGYELSQQASNAYQSSLQAAMAQTGIQRAWLGGLGSAILGRGF
jgi:hypothetical protein